MSGAGAVHVFGIRHLSPMGAWQLRRFLDRVQPQALLIEGPHGAEALVSAITHRQTVPPIGILAYSDTVPVRTFVYPLALYSPEYQVILWAKEHRAKTCFIDLPSDVFLGLQARQAQQAALSNLDEGESEQALSQEGRAEAPPGRGLGELALESVTNRAALYARIAQLSGETHYEDYWERNFEHNTNDDVYRQASLSFGEQLREVDEDAPTALAENLVREAYMRRRIQEVVAEGVAPEKIVAVVGAFHAPLLGPEYPPMTDDQLASLDRLPCSLTLMPYSYFRLSTHSGYGAGNAAPAYFEMLWEALNDGALRELPARYLSKLVRLERDAGNPQSTASVIEAARLARSLSALKGGCAPVLRDLQDAATTTVGHGERASIAKSMARVEVGTAIGSLPPGVSQTSIQEDFQQQLIRLKLTKYRSTVRQDLSLDLRENRRARTEETAYLHLSRSTFLHRLSLLGISFCEPARARQDSATWRENWVLQWTPEAEIELVESVLLGETIEFAAAFKFKGSLEACDTVDQAAQAVSLACKCGMMRAMEQARTKLQDLAVSASGYLSIANAAASLAEVVKYGDVRRFETGPLEPLIATLFVQAALALYGEAGCDDSTAHSVAQGMDALDRVAHAFDGLADQTLWITELQRLSRSDARNPLLSGVACAILLERDELDSDDLTREVSRRLSPGAPADLGAGWFEGLSRRNRYALLTRQGLWEALAGYVSALDEEEFRRALVFLRRAFGAFSPHEKRSIAENLGQIWGVHESLASEAINQPLTQEEEARLDELNEFDFDDL